MGYFTVRSNKPRSEPNPGLSGHDLVDLLGIQRIVLVPSKRLNLLYQRDQMFTRILQSYFILGSTD